MSSCYTCVPKIMIISFMLPEIWGVTQIFCHFGPFFVLLAPPPPPPLLQPRKSKFWENEKNVFTHVYHKWWSYDKVFQIAIRRGGKRGGEGVEGIIRNFFTGWWEPEEEWFWRLELFSKLKTAFCEYWTSIKFKKTKMMQEQWLQLKMTFLLGCNLKIVI